jgi:DNA-binding NarL/FixJ family response regulator
MLSPKVTRTLIDRLRADSDDDRAEVAQRRLAVLTEREQDVALAVGGGLTNAEIARELHLSIPTVKAHVSRLFDKLHVTNRVQIAICVHDAGLV